MIWVKDAFLIHMPNKIVRFRHMSNGLYAVNLLGNDIYKRTKKSLCGHSWRILGFLTPRQQERAKMGRALYCALGIPSLANLKAMMLIKNYSVTPEDNNLAAQAFGLNVATIKGKTTRTNLAPVVEILMNYWKPAMMLPFQWTY